MLRFKPIILGTSIAAMAHIAMAQPVTEVIVVPVETMPHSAPVETAPETSAAPILLNESSTLTAPTEATPNIVPSETSGSSMSSGSSDSGSGMTSSGIYLIETQPATAADNAATMSNDPIVQRREARAQAKQEYRERKREAKQEYRQEKEAADALVRP